MIHTVAPGLRRRMAERCETVVESAWFALAGLGVILLNAVLLGLETYDPVVAAAGPALRTAEHLCLAGFAAELAVRFAARLDRPGRFFRDGWNLFDLAIVVAPLLPGVRENVSVLRLLRLARLVRTFRLFPSLRVILVGIRRALPGLGSFLLITVLVVYGYAMLGWMMFGDAYPEKYGTVGQAMLTLFLLLSLDGITDTLEAGRQVHGGAVLYYISYMVAACYLLTNMLVGLVLTALQEAHEAERSVRQKPAATPVHLHLADLRASLDALERRLTQTDPPPAPRAAALEPSAPRGLTEEGTPARPS
ncbi:ion transporter [Symbioplanes lichenis]|uniref:ion transporter n=1 Tax=Symbioplanes lichenis TaxID=1629072 RepID=UPI0027390E87|nr:ion transporter [Actinoplanes lichenis]